MNGRCYYCNKEVEKRGIKRHLNSCKERKERIADFEKKKTSDYYIIEFCDKYNKSDYWLYIACHKNNKLKDLDRFLRDVWVECCGHLSEFVIDGIRFSGDDMDYEDLFYDDEKQSLDVKLKDILEVGTKINYDYDFGSTTTLIGKVVGYFKYYTEENNIEIMARHNNPEYNCVKCGNKAAYANEYGECICEECADELDEEEYLTELGDMSSPRCGVCGYYGTRENENKYLLKIN